MLHYSVHFFPVEKGVDRKLRFRTLPPLFIFTMNQKTYSLQAKKREQIKHSARTARTEKDVPCVVYGPKFETVQISVPYSDLLRTYREAGESSLIDLNIDGKAVKVLVHEISYHPVRDSIQHVDFYAVDLKAKTDVDVPLVFKGESPAVKNLGGLFMREKHTITIKCLPTDIPHEIEVNIASLVNVGDHIKASDIPLDRNKFELLDKPDMLICSVVAPKEEKIEEGRPEDQAVPVEGQEEGAEGEAGEEKESGEKAKKEEKKEKKE